jgi:hypothetical protein
VNLGKGLIKKTYSEHFRPELFEGSFNVRKIVEKLKNLAFCV